MKKILIISLMFIANLGVLSLYGECGRWDLACKAREAAAEAKRKIQEAASWAEKQADEAKRKLQEAAATVKEKITTAATSVEDKFKSAAKSMESQLQSLAVDATELKNVAQKMVENWSKEKEKLKDIKYCDSLYSGIKPTSFLPNPFSAYTSESPKEITEQDKEGLLPYIKKYAPIVYLQEDEIYYPLWINEYFSGPGSTIKDRSKGDTAVAPAGTLTFEKIYTDFYVGKNSNDNLYIDVPQCTLYGSNPNGVGYTAQGEVKNKDGQGNLTVPMYVVTSEEKGKIYIQYLMFYGLNGPYDVGPLKGNVAEFQNYHESDLEHITVELDKNTKELQRVYYGSHGKTEGFWLAANHPAVKREDGRIVVYSAHYGHGNYPSAGTYVRIYGFANDVTGKGQRWIPQNLIRLYPDKDERFDAKTMGWQYFIGRNGAHGIDPAGTQSWFPKLDENRKFQDTIGVQGDIGREYDPEAWFCANPADDSLKARAVYEACLLLKAKNAKIPE